MMPTLGPFNGANFVEKTEGGKREGGFEK